MGNKHSKSQANKTDPNDAKIIGNKHSKSQSHNPYTNDAKIISNKHSKSEANKTDPNDEKSIFKNGTNKCYGCYDCHHLERIIKALSYHSKMSLNEPNTFADFCDKYYSKQYLEDYIHFICVHGNDINDIQKLQTNDNCLNVNDCLCTKRHYQDRMINDNNKRNENIESGNLYIDIFDSIHFYIYHIEECLRVSINDDDIKNDIENENDSDYRDQVIVAIQKQIEDKKKKYGSFKRLDNRNNYNSKFNNDENEEKKEKSIAFETGFVFWYWPFYKQIKQSSFSDLCVDKHFNSLKDEVLDSKLITIKQFKNVIKKCDAYYETQTCKNIKSHSQNDPMHYDIKYDAKLNKSHLCALILYCDFIALCNEICATFKRIKSDESIKSVAQRNAKYFHISKNLREVIQYYGSITESGPFFLGLDVVLNISEFAIRLNAPTSTSMRKEIAIRIATKRGMLIVVNNEKRPGSLEKYFDVSWLSAFAEEEQRIFCGGRYPLELQTVIVMQTNNNYQTLFKSFFKFDQMLSGGANDDEVMQSDVEIISWFISYIFGVSKNNNKFDEFIKNSFYHFVQKKTQILLHLPRLSNKKNKNFTDLVMHPTGCQKNGEIPTDRTNLFQSCLFKIFDNLNEIIIYSTDGYGDAYSFNVLELLEILQEIELPKAFKTIIIKDSRCLWLKDVFSSQVKEAFASKNLNIELKTGHEDLMVICV